MTYGLINLDAGTLVSRLFETEGLAFQWLRQHQGQTSDHDTYRIVGLKGKVQLLEALSCVQN